MKRIVLLAALLLSGAGALAQAQDGWAIVELSGCFVRNAPDYESGVDTQARMGDVVQLLGKDRYWYEVRTPEPYSGWVTELALSLKSEDEIAAYRLAPKWICTAEYTHVFEEPSTEADRVCDFVMADVVRKTGASVPGWVGVMLPSGRTGWVEADAVSDLQEWESTRVCTAGNVISLARKFLGVPYMWGGISPKYFDCSGLVRFCFMMNGIQLPRDCSQQIKAGTAVPCELSCMKPGDLLFFGDPATGRPGHVGIYIGGGRFIHASQLVRISSLCREDPDCYGGRPLIAVRRIVE